MEVNALHTEAMRMEVISFIIITRRVSRSGSCRTPLEQGPTYIKSLEATPIRKESGTVKDQMGKVLSQHI